MRARGDKTSERRREKKREEERRREKKREEEEKKGIVVVGDSVSSFMEDACYLNESEGERRKEKAAGVFEGPADPKELTLRRRKTGTSCWVSWQLACIDGLEHWILCCCSGTC